MQSYKGYVSSIIYRNRENLYTVFVFHTDDAQFTCTGYPAAIAEGESARLSGEMVTHPVYGEQLKVAEYCAVPPEGKEAVRRYLSSGAVKGIGPALAARILKKFGDDTMRILNEEPERLAEVKGISSRTAREIAAQLEGQRETRDAMVFLQQYGLGGRRAVRVWETYGPEMYTVLRENPYRLAEDIDGIGFATADEIAQRAGIRADDAFRVRSGILFVLSENLQEGSTWLPEDLLISKAMQLLNVPEEPVRDQLPGLAAERKIRILVPSRRTGAAKPSCNAEKAQPADTAQEDIHLTAGTPGHLKTRPADAAQEGIQRTAGTPGHLKTRPADAAQEGVQRTAGTPEHLKAQPVGAVHGAAVQEDLPSAEAKDDFPQSAPADVFDEFPDIPDEEEIFGERAAVPQIYLTGAYRLEQRIARRLLQLDERPSRTWSEHEMDLRIRHMEEKGGIRLDELQRRAVKLAASRGILLLSGGPGTGKTTTIRSIIRLFESDARPVVLAAPTGRAAKRMSEATGQEAMTIHRLLECKVSGGESDAPARDGRGGAWYFDRNEKNPLEAEVVIIDEMSMVDLYLFDALLKAVAPGTTLILVGDTNQLPSVGPGRVFGDLMDSGRFESIVLQKIFRQAQESDIVMNAHRILQGEPLLLDNHSKDFFFLERSDPQVIYKHIVMLLRDKLPGYTGSSWEEIQVLTPMRRGPLGAVRLNEVLQSVLNPKEDGKAEITAHNVTFRVGDKVMQTRNNYRIEWEIPGPYGIPKEKGEGIFNGDFGIITGIDRDAAQVELRLDEDRRVHYPFAELEDLDLAYAVTVHKSQGSEYPAVILPLLGGPPALLNRNLLYTAVTRAKHSVVILGSRDTVRRMEENVRESGRRTGLRERLEEM